MHFYSIIAINKKANLSLNFGLNDGFWNSYNRENAKVDSRLPLVI